MKWEDGPKINGDVQNKYYTKPSLNAPDCAHYVSNPTAKRGKKLEPTRIFFEIPNVHTLGEVLSFELGSNSLQMLLCDEG